jgi:hypothetical protein
MEITAMDNRVIIGPEDVNNGSSSSKESTPITTVT